MQSFTINYALFTHHGIGSTSHGNTSLTQRPNLTLEQKKNHVSTIEEVFFKPCHMSHEFGH